MKRHILSLSVSAFLVTPLHANPAQINDEMLIQALGQGLQQGIDLSKYPDALAEFKEHVSNCGPGVVEGFTGENRCTHTIRLDQTFLTPIREKTGYIYDPEWPLADGVQFMTASQKEMDEVPEAWDLKDVGPMTDIHSQKCGDCWSTSSRKLLEQALATHGTHNPDGSLIGLSEQTTLSSCCTWCGSCSGGYMSTPNFFSVEGSNAYGYGLPTRDLDPYKGANSSCKFTKDQLKGFEHKLITAPYVGSSLAYSRFFKPEERSGPKVRNTMALMHKYKSNALITISAISSSGGIITSCSNINSGGNHMQNIVGWYKSGAENIARIQNSWGTSHGQNGYTHLRWECGEGKFNRGAGVSTRVGVYKLPESCSSISNAYAGNSQRFVRGPGRESVVIGRESSVPQTCTWLPQAGIVEVLSPDGCMIRVSPELPTEYHVTAIDHSCGTETSAMTVVTPTDHDGTPTGDGKLLTPHGITKL